ncbi:hypothetical protein DL96DRAFT_1825861 [Flagelloscypha sp. PMI_526]|nr:hypothetical protein DL96DRAFT_1825861 [Flagelloscypha sp. PMI_526]
MSRLRIPAQIPSVRRLSHSRNRYWKWLACHRHPRLKLEYPDAYDRTQYHIIEASSKLVEIQRAKLLPRHPLVTLDYKSALDWDRIRFPHSYQALVTVSKDYDLDTIHETITDPPIRRLLNLRLQLGPCPLYFRLFENSTMRNLYNAVLFSANLTPPKFIPTSLLSLILTLRTYFPRHALLLGDFSLPDIVLGTATPISPVVQTRVHGRTVTTESYLVQPG